MEHKTFDELKAAMQGASSKVSVGSLYWHYKDSQSRYKVTGLSIMEDSEEVAVKYSSLKDSAVEFIRPLSSWLSETEWNGKVVPRFTLVV